MPADARRFLIAAFLLLVLGGAAEPVRQWRVPPALYQPTFAEVPMNVGVYRGEDRAVDQSIYNFLGASAILERVYLGPERVPVRLSLVYAPDWRAIHSPESCLPNQGWQVIEQRTVALPAPPDFPVPGPLRVKIIQLQKDRERLLALYSFAYYGGTTADWAQMSRKVVLGPRGAGGLLYTLNTPVTKADSEAGQRLEAILTATYPPALAFWYGEPRAAGDR